jgi:hypothetical protein
MRGYYEFMGLVEVAAATGFTFSPVRTTPGRKEQDPARRVDQGAAIRDAGLDHNKEATQPFSSMDNDYAFGEMYEAGKGNIADFAGHVTPRTPDLAGSQDYSLYHGRESLGIQPSPPSRPLMGQSVPRVQDRGRGPQAGVAAPTGAPQPRREGRGGRCQRDGGYCEGNRDRPTTGSGLVLHIVDDRTDNRGDDRPGRATADQLSGHGTEIEPPAPPESAGMSALRIEPPPAPPSAPAIVLPSVPRFMFLRVAPTALPPIAPPIA